MALDDIVTALYLEHLTEHDLALLCGSYHEDPRGGDLRGLVRSRRGGIEGFLGSREIFEAVFGAGPNREVLRVSPFLVFAVAVRRAAHELNSTPFVPEWPGAGRRALVMDVPRLREFVSSPVHRFFLAELLASYARVASGSVLVATPRGLRRRRFSELDPVQLAGLVEVVENAERPGVLRRLGDLALFLTGVFPDYVARRGFGPVDQGRLLRVAAIGGTGRGGAPRSGRVGGDDAVALLARLGRRWYELASHLLPRPLPADVAVIGEMPERFDDARRVLSVVAERFLFPHRDRWFGLPAS
jgi:hypothetical protein